MNFRREVQQKLLTPLEVHLSLGTHNDKSQLVTTSHGDFELQAIPMFLTDHLHRSMVGVFIECSTIEDRQYVAAVCII